MTDYDLIRRCQTGDGNAFEALLERYYDVIYRIAYRWCEDQTNAQDITQLACMKLAKALQGFKFGSAFTSWLYSIVINTARDFYKSPNQYNQREAQIDDLEKIDTHFERTDSHIPARGIYAQQILTHIETLTDDLKETLILVYVNGLNHREAAVELNIKESTVSWRVHEARKLLKQTFKSSSLYTDDIRGTV